MKSIHFSKMSGCGNDFILIDNRDMALDQEITPEFIQKICRRKMSVGADGLILVENSRSRDFKWRFFNSDGSRAEMCGNGARCAARFAFLNGIAGKDMAFETDAGIIYAKVLQNSVKIRMPSPSGIEEGISLTVGGRPLKMCHINTGVPHVVIFVDDIDEPDMVLLGREIRFHKRFAPAGTNVNAVCIQDNDSIAVRTYERGVEDETLACGTGVVAAALVLAHQTGQPAPIRIRTRSGGLLTVHFTKENGQVTEVFLEGDARIIYQGQLHEEAWEYGLKAED
jgi:diaminopimelate epimerase